MLGIGEEVQLTVGRQDRQELILNHLNGISTFLKRMLKLNLYLPLIVFIQSFNKAFLEEAEVQTVRATWISRFFLSIFDHVIHHLHGVSSSLAHHLMMTVLRALRIILQDLLSDYAQLLI